MVHLSLDGMVSRMFFAMRQCLARRPALLVALETPWRRLAVNDQQRSPHMLERVSHITMNCSLPVLCRSQL